MCDFCQLPDGYLLHIQHAEPDSLSVPMRRALAIYRDISDRRGLSGELDQIDDEIIEDMLRTWVNLINTIA